MAVEILKLEAPTPAEAEFQEKMRERLRQAMGDLMPDEVLKGIVARGVEEAFFKKRLRADSPTLSKWDDRRRETYPSWLEEFVEKELRGRVRTQVDQFFRDHADEVMGMVQGVFQSGLASAVLGQLDRLFSTATARLAEDVGETLRKLRGS